MSNIKKRQHYVWRHYLKNWTDKESIWTLFKKLNKIERTGLMKVAQEKYFYRLSDFTNEEEKLLKNYLEETTPVDLKGLVLDFFTVFTGVSRLKKQMKENLKGNIKLTEEIRKLEINIMEEAHSFIENEGHKLIRCESISDLKSLDNPESDLFGAVMFLCFQYFRTRQMKTTALQNFKGDGIRETLVRKSWNIISYQMSTILARSVCLDKNVKYAFIKNQTNTPFITGDQPVFNVLSDQRNADGSVIDLELYYPLSPQRALNIHFKKNQTQKFIEKQADEELVYFFNKKVVENSSFYVFADKKEALELMEHF